jgi:hypothetical protein
MKNNAECLASLQHCVARLGSPIKTAEEWRAFSETLEQASKYAKKTAAMWAALEERSGAATKPHDPKAGGK